MHRLSVILLLVVLLAWQAPQGALASCQDYDMNSILTLDQFATTSTTYGIASSGNTMVAATANGIEIIDYESGSGSLLSTLTFTEPAYDVAINGIYAYVATGASITVVNLQDPENPITIGSVSTNEMALGVGFSGDSLWAHTNSRVFAWDITVPAAPRYRRMSNPFGNGLRNLVVASGGAYLSRETNLTSDTELLVFDVVPENNLDPSGNLVPRAVMTEFLPGAVQPESIRGLACDDYRLYVAYMHPTEDHGVLPLDLTDPVNPIPMEPIAALSADWEVDEILVAGHFLYAVHPYLSSPGTLSIVDLTDIQNPELTARMEATHANAESSRLRTIADRVVINRQDILYSFDQQCDTPVVIPETVRAWMEPTENEFVNNWHFEWTTEHWTDPVQDVIVVLDNPRSQPVCSVGYVRKDGDDFGVTTSVEFVSGEGYRHHLWFNHGECNSGCFYYWSGASTRAGQSGYIALGDPATWPTLDIKFCLQSGEGPVPPKSAQLPTIPTVESVFPNPFNPSTTIRFYVPTEAANVVLTIHDVSGKRVRNLGSDSGKGWNEVTWYGRDDSGHSVGSGTYFVQLRANGSVVSTQKVTMLK